MSSSLFVRAAVPKTLVCRLAITNSTSMFHSQRGDGLLTQVFSTGLVRCKTTVADPYAYVPGGRAFLLHVLFDLLFTFTVSPAIYKGTVNDPTSFPTPSRTHGSYHWSFERLLSAALVPLTGAAFVTSGSAYPLLDGILGVALIMHSHIGVSLVQFVLGILLIMP